MFAGVADEEGYDFLALNLACPLTSGRSCLEFFKEYLMSRVRGWKSEGKRQEVRNGQSIFEIKRGKKKKIRLGGGTMASYSRRRRNVTAASSIALKRKLKKMGKNLQRRKFQRACSSIYTRFYMR